MDNQLKMTCLHDRHVELGAKMSPFAGFDMPIQYSGIIDEHNAVRTKAGMFEDVFSIQPVIKEKKIYL